MLQVTATELPRLLACNGSRSMGGFVPPVESDDTVKKEGIAAHWAVEQIHHNLFSVEEIIDQKSPNGIYITSEMIDHLSEYLFDLLGAQIEVETSFQVADVQINGRADSIKYNVQTGVLYVNDLKYGWSLVEPEMNWTLLAHVFGFIVRNPTLPVLYARLTIYQPRPHHSNGRVRSWLIDNEQIRQLFAGLQTILSNLNDQLQTGPHCNHCPALANCPAARKAQFNAIEASGKAFVDTLGNDDLSNHLDLLKRSIEVLTQAQKAYNELALFRLKQGEIIQNYSLENELTNRLWLEHVTPEIMLAITGKKLTKEELITPAQAEKAGVSKEVVSSLTERRNKGVKLIRVDADTKARKIFNNPERKSKK